MKCPKCGEENDDGSQFCGNCGKDLNANKSSINKNALIICITVIICIAIVAAAFVMINNNSSEDVAINNTTSQTADANQTAINKTKKISETHEDESADDSSNARLGSRENPKTSPDYSSGHDGELNPNYGDYYYIDGGLYRDDNKYLGGAGTYTFISGNNPYE